MSQSAPSLPPPDTTIGEITLTPQQQRKWIETRSALLWKCPAFTHILFSMLTPKGNELAATFSTDVPYAATDGRVLILNPETFFEWTLDERVFVLAHEILHCIYNHVDLCYPMRRSGKVKYADGTELPYDHKMMNVAMDLVINDTLIADRIGSFPRVGVHDPSIATRDDSFLDAYRKVHDHQQKNGGAGGGAGGFDAILDPGAAQGQDPGQATQGRSQTEWDTAVAAAIASAKLQGKLPANLERLLGSIIEPQVSWVDHIRGFFARRLGSGGYDWRAPDRHMILRDIFIPRRSGHGCGTIVVGVDTSGSVGQAELDVFFGEMRGMLDDLRPQQIHVVWCDAKVHKVDTVDDAQDIDGLKAHGGGGTDFRPVFDWIADQPDTIDALVYLTDGYGSFPDKEPPYPLIWGNISGKAVRYPFGEVVDIEIK